MRKLRVFGVAVLLVVLAACEKGVSDGGISIRFSLGDTSYGADEVRGAEMQSEPETVVVPVEGVVHMYATLAEDGESPLRAAGDEVMANGTRLVIAAYNESNTYVTSAEYEVTNNSGGIKPTAASGIGLTLSTTGKYRFVAYSLNLTTVPAYAPSIGPYSPNSAGDDPLWGDSGETPVTVTEGVNDIRIAMRHAFSQVTLKASSADLAGTRYITDLSAILVGYKAVIQNGSLGKGAAEEQAFASFGPYGTTAVTSPPKLVYVGGDAVTTIKIISATIGGTTHTGSVARFNKQLLPGRRYILNVRFDELVWAGSNVYWVITSGNNGYLTFDATDKGNQGYQGVFFKWGSLVGISPAQTGGSDAFLISTPVYVPNYNAGTPSASSWVRSTGYDPAKWVETVSGVAENDADAIPYLDGRSDFNALDYTRNNTFVIDAERNTDAMYLGKRGDICQYIGKTAPNTEEGKKLKGFRLPTSSEFGTVTENWDGTTPKGGGWMPTVSTWTVKDATAGNPEGTANLLESAKNNAGKVFAAIQNNGMGGVVLPASGLRIRSFLLDWVGQTGYYVSGSAANEICYWRMHFSGGSGVGIDIQTDRAFAISVRCVRN